VFSLAGHILRCRITATALTSTVEVGQAGRQPTKATKATKDAYTSSVAAKL
jgi:hypothetical protein